MSIFLTVLHVLVCLVLILVVLLQRGKGAEIGAVFGGGGSSTVFGSRGAGNFFTKLTTGAAAVFMVTSLSLAYIANQSQGLFDGDEAADPAVTETAPEAAGDEGFGEVGTTPAPAPEAAPEPAGESGGFVEVPPAEPLPAEAAPEAPATP